MQNEYIDLPINIQQTPKNLLEKVNISKVPESVEQAANQILKSLEIAIKGQQNDLYTCYYSVMVPTYKQKFVDKQWPTVSSLQQSLDTQYKTGAQTIYKQFSLRTAWNKTKNQKDMQKYWDAVDQAWEQYTSIFKLEYSRINFHPEMIWDYFHSFLEIYLFHKSRGPTISQSPKAKSQIFDKTQTKSMFKQLLPFSPNNANTTTYTTKQIFAYYSRVALAVIEMSQGNFKQALNYISKISLKQTIVLSKGLGSLLTAFFVSAFSHFMLEQYYKSVKLCETIVPFYLKYRKFFDKSFQFQTKLQPLFEKLAILQCISYVFLQQKPRTIYMQIFKNTNVKTKQKQARDKMSDCFFKMKQNDLSTFLRLFNFLCSQYSIPNIEKTVTQKFKSLQSINLNTIIQNYKRIQLQKMAKMLNISKQEVLNKIKSIGAVEKSDSEWDNTIMNPLLKQKKKVNVLIEGNVAVFDSQTVDHDQSSRQWKRYKQQISWLNQKVKVL